MFYAFGRLTYQSMQSIITFISDDKKLYKHVSKDGVAVLKNIIQPGLDMEIKTELDLLTLPPTRTGC